MQAPEPMLDVLLVDDCADTLRFLSYELTGAGFRTHTARHGRDALSKLAALRFEAVLLDVLMPGMDGFETCRQLRRQDNEVPVIFMTGLSASDQIVQGFESGATDYVTKPLALPEVIARLRAHTSTARIARATRQAVNLSDIAMLALNAQGHTLWRNLAFEQLASRVGLAQAGSTGLPSYFSTVLMRAASTQTTESIVLDIAVLRIKPLGEPDASVKLFSVALQGNQAITQARTQTLTAREAEVLLWVSRGKTNRDIAEILMMSPRTVNKHLEHIFEKLGVETRTAAAALVRNG